MKYYQQLKSMNQYILPRDTEVWYWRAEYYIWKYYITQQSVSHKVIITNVQKKYWKEILYYAVLCQDTEEK